MQKVRLTNNPEVEVEVNDIELVDLTRWGLVVQSNATTTEGIRRAAAKQVEANTPKEGTE